MDVVPARYKYRRDSASKPRTAKRNRIAMERDSKDVARCVSFGIDQSGIETLFDRLTEAAVLPRAFECRLSAVLASPSIIRVLWVGCSGGTPSVVVCLAHVRKGPRWAPVKHGLLVFDNFTKAKKECAALAALTDFVLKLGTARKCTEQHCQREMTRIEMSETRISTRVLDGVFRAVFEVTMDEDETDLMDEVLDDAWAMRVRGAESPKMSQEALMAWADSIRKKLDEIHV